MRVATHTDVPHVGETPERGPSVGLGVAVGSGVGVAVGDNVGVAVGSGVGTGVGACVATSWRFLKRSESLGGAEGGRGAKNRTFVLRGCGGGGCVSAFSIQSYYRAPRRAGPFCEKKIKNRTMHTYTLNFSNSHQMFINF